MAGPETPAEITAAVKQIDAEFEPKPLPPTPEQKANLKQVADQLFGD